MKNVLVTGSNGFIGKNLIEALNRKEDVCVKCFDREDTTDTLVGLIKDADFIYHIAGANRPKNVDLTQKIVDILATYNKKAPIVYTSSIQAGKDNPYGKSKKRGEDILIKYSVENNVPIYIYRLLNVFGKWAKPNYNSVVATFCYNIARNIEIEISDPKTELELIYIDDLVEEFLKAIEREGKYSENYFFKIDTTFKITLKRLAEVIYEFKNIKGTQIVPDMYDRFTRCLYATYLSCVDKDELHYELDTKSDNRGQLTEIIKSRHFGQIFISKSNKGVIRGNHYHNTKIEKFCVIEGKAVIRLRNIFSNDSEKINYYVSGDKIKIVDIPPGYTHSIENLSDGELIVLFWADEIFNPCEPDTYFKEV